MWYPGNMLPNLLLLHQFCIAIVNFAFPSFPVDKLLLHVVYNHTKRLSTLHLNNLVVYTTHRRRSCTTLILGRCRKDNNVATRSCNTVDRRASSLPKLVVCSMPFQTMALFLCLFFFSLFLPSAFISDESSAATHLMVVLAKPLAHALAHALAHF